MTKAQRTQREQLAEAQAKLRAVEALIPELERNRSTGAVAKRLRAILGLAEQKKLFQ